MNKQKELLQVLTKLYNLCLRDKHLLPFDWDPVIKQAEKLIKEAIQ